MHINLCMPFLFALWLLIYFIYIFCKRFKSFILNGKIKYHNIVILYKNIDLNNIINNIYSTFPVAKVAKAHTIFILKFEYYCIIVLCSIIFNLLIFVL